MWLYFNPPVERIKEKYGVELTPEALDHLRKSSLRFATYGSASFVSSNGLVMTNHHVGEMTVNSLSSEENNLARDGFIAEKLEDEIKCPRLKLRMLSELIDVTDRVKEASASAEDEESANRAEREASRQIAESASSEKGLICEVQSYFAGSLYLLYC